jgi:fatty acid desaturase
MTDRSFLFWFFNPYSLIIMKLHNPIKAFSFTFHKNVGKTERIIRLLIAAAGISLFAFGTVAGGLGIVVLVVVFAMLGTGISGKCPMHYIAGIDTTGKARPVQSHESKNKQG